MFTVVGVYREYGDRYQVELSSYSTEAEAEEEVARLEMAYRHSDCYEYFTVVEQ